MNHKMNNKENVSSSELVRTVISSVVEDLDNNFEEYASEFVKNFSKFNEDEKENIFRWKTKILNKIRKDLDTENLIDG